MTSNIFILNGHQKWPMSPGRLNRTLVDEANTLLSAKGHQVRTTHIDEDWKAADEVEKMLWADIVLVQFPVYWFGVPWGMKKYIDEVYMAGHGKIFLNDGRTRDDPSRKYGSGGLLQGRKYMLSTTWSGPQEALDEPDQLFDGKGVDGVFMWLHKVYEFCGLEGLPSFSCHDVMKIPDIESDLKRWRAHLEANL